MSDITQLKYMDEKIIVVDNNDNIICPATKKECHLVSNGLLLHRAFSVFLFNSKNELLLQERSKYKITFLKKIIISSIRKCFSIS